MKNHLTKFNAFFMIKAVKKKVIFSTLSHKGIYEKPTYNIGLSDERMNTFPLRLKKTRLSAIIPSSQHSTGV